MDGNKVANVKEPVNLTGKTAIVTGANTGIGKVTGKELARLGARVILACRSLSRGEAAKQEIADETGSQNVCVKQLDLSSLDSVRAFAEDFNRTETNLHLLVNNAGIITPERWLTSDGFEQTFATNHLGHFLLTNLLLDKLKSSAPSRVVIVSSDAHNGGPIKLDDLQSEKKFSSFLAYARSKSANVLFGVHLAKVLKDSGVTAYSLHPGVVQTEFGRDLWIKKNACCSCFIGCLVNCFTCGKYLSPEDGAQTTLYCCLEPSIALDSGKYYANCKEKPAKSHAVNEEVAEKLWNESAKLVGINN